MSTTLPETWLFDLGNSRAKAARLVDGTPAEVTAVEWNQPDFAASWRRLFAAWPRPRRIWLASVAPAAGGERLRELLPNDPLIELTWLRSPRAACGIRNCYARPERLGIDRFLAMVAVHARAPGAAIVVGCGTAMTLDAVAADGEHAAGLISLSPTRMLESLRSDTAIAATNPYAFGAGEDDTAAALREGCWASAGATVEWFAARQRAALGAAPITLHGGSAEPLRDWLLADGCAVTAMPHAVLHGLAIWAGGGVQPARRGR